MNQHPSKIDAMGPAHQKAIDDAFARDDAIERRQIELYDDMWKGHDPERMFQVFEEDVVTQESVQLLCEAMLKNKEEGWPNRPLTELYFILEEATSRRALDWATYEVDHPPKEEV